MDRLDESDVIGVGMSGGADSSLAAYLLHEAGYRVRGYTMRLWGESSSKSSDAHVARAVAVCERIGVPHAVVDMREAFDNAIVAPFIDSYRRGLTPSPCVRCNMGVKFGLLLEQALADGCTRLATGHYARMIRDGDGRLRLQRGKDDHKDQTYFLAGLSQDQLRRALFPLGELKKTDVKIRADALGLIPHSQSESQDLCFIPDGDYARFIEARIPALSRPGRLVDSEGRELGEHRGTFRYTIGQRRGLGLSGGPWYVTGIDPGTNTVTVGRKEDLFSTEVSVAEATWQCLPPSPGCTRPATVQLRYNMRAVEATVEVLDGDRLRLDLARPVSAVTPGQFAVMYEDELVLGGGWITEQEKS